MLGTQLPNLGLFTGYGVDDVGWDQQLKEDLIAIDTLSQCRVLSSSVLAQPTDPLEHDVYALPLAATGAEWGAHGGDVARWCGDCWTFYEAKPGWLVWDVAADALMLRTGTGWVAVLSHLTSVLDTRVTSLEAAAATLTTNLAAEVTARSALNPRVDSLESVLTSEASTRAAADTALASQLTALDARLDVVEPAQASQAGAIAAIESRVTATESGIGGLSADITDLYATIDDTAIGGRGVNHLPARIASFEDATSPVIATVACTTSLQPLASHGAQSLRVAMTGAGGFVRTQSFAIEPNRRWIVSAKIRVPALQGAALNSFSMGLDFAGNVNLALLPSVANDGQWHRVSGPLLTDTVPGSSAQLVIQHNGYTVPVQAYFDELMLEEWVGSLTTPSAWVMPPEPIAASEAYQSLSARVTAAEGVNTAQSTSLTNLSAQVTAVESANTAQGAAVNALDVRVTATEGTLTSHSSSITTLQAQVSALPTTYVQPNEPTGGSYDVGDQWVDTDDNNALYTWDGATWVAAATLQGATIYAQPTAPAGGVIGDLWFNTGDNNRQYRWSGAVWVEMTDPRIAANTSAISSLDARTTNAEGLITGHTSALTSLDSRITAAEGVNTSQASALSSLDTRVTSAEGVNTSQASALTSLSTTVGGHTSTISAQQSSINGLLANYSLRLDVNGYVTGWEFNNDGSTGDFTIVADKFRVISPGNPSVAPFEVVGGETFIKSAHIQNLTINKLTAGVLNADMQMGTGRIVFDNGTYMKVQGVGFGSNNQFIEWFGPRQTNFAYCTETNAISWLKTDGSAYYGGSLSVGTTNNSIKTTNTVSNAEVTLGPFSTGGNQKTLIASYDFHTSGSSAGNVTNAINAAVYSATVVVERSVNGGVWTVVQTLNIAGDANEVFYDFESGSTYYAAAMGGGVTWTDNTTSTSDLRFRIRLTARSAPYSDFPVQTLSLTSIEEASGGGTTGPGNAPAIAQYLVMTPDPTLTNERVLVAGSGLNFVDNGPGSSLVLSATGDNSRAPADASFVTIGTSSGLSAERVLTAGANVSITDGGANGPVTISAAGGVDLVVSATAPPSPVHKMQWLDTTSGRTLTYLNDGDSSQWVELGPTVVAAGVAITEEPAVIDGGTY